MTSQPVVSRWFAVELADDARIGALAFEAALSEADIDALEARLVDPGVDSADRLATALQVARAGRRSSGPALAELRRERLRAGAEDEALVVRATLDLLALRPPNRLQRGDSGYRFEDEGVELFIEDPLAEHWHARRRWGPPIRPDLERSPRYFRPHADPKEVAAFALDGGVVVVGFSAGRTGRSPAALRVTRAGFGFDAALSTMIRWSELSSLGWVQGDEQGERRLAYEVRGRDVRALPPRPSCGVEPLMALFEACSAVGRSS